MVCILRATAIAVMITCNVATTAGGQNRSDFELADEDLKDVLAAADFLDDEIVAKWKRIIARAEQLYPELVDLLDRTDDPIVVSRILAIFSASTGDKTEPRKALRKLIVRMRTSRDVSARVAEKNLNNAATALGEIGTFEDVSALLPLLEHSSEFVRSNAVRALGKIGNEATAERIEQVLEGRAKGLAAQEIAKDKSFLEGYEAIGRIKYRMLQKKHRAK